VVRALVLAHLYVDWDGGVRPNGDYARNAYEIMSGNYARQTIPVNYREPDLEISGLVTADQAISGQQVSLSWNVDNAGTRETRQSYWTDSVYLSRDPSLDRGDVRLVDVTRIGTLPAGGAYAAQATVTLPEGIDGSYHLLVVTDDDNAVLEFQDEGDNLAVHPLTISLQEPPNLQVTAVTIPQRATVGQKFDLSYEVSNVGTGATPPTQTTRRRRPRGATSSICHAIASSISRPTATSGAAPTAGRWRLAPATASRSR